MVFHPGLQRPEHLLFDGAALDMDDAHAAGSLSLAICASDTLDVHLNAHQGSIEHHRVGGSQSDPMRRGLRLHDQYTRVRVRLEAPDDVAALGGSHVAVNLFNGVPTAFQELRHGIQCSAEQREDDDLAVGLLHHFLQHAQARRGVKLDDLFVVGQSAPRADLQQLTHAGSGVHRTDGLACSLGQHLLLEQLVVLGLLRRHGHVARLCQHWRQVKALLFGVADRGLQRFVHERFGIGLWQPLEHGRLVHDLVTPAAKQMRHAGGVHQLGQAIRVEGGLRCGSARHEPQPRIGPHQFVERLPAPRGDCLEVRGFVDNDEVEPAV